MKIYHVSDLHIGRDFNGYDLCEDQRYTLMHLCDMVEKEKIKYLLLAGDIFDKYNPSNEATELFEDFITRLSGLMTRVIIISGNHDSKARLGYLKSFLRKDNIYIYTEIPENPIEFSDDKIAIMPIPYLHDFELKSRYKDISDNAIDIYKSLIADFNSKVTPGYTKICMCHNFILGGEVSTSERTLSVGGCDEMPAGLFKGFDYTALGHLHILQKMGHNIYYSGSIMKYSTSEFKNNNSLIEFETSDNSVKIIPLPQKRGARIIKDSIDNILANAIVDPSPNDFIAVELTDNGVVYNAFSRISEYYPYLVSLNQASRRAKIEENEVVEVDENASPKEIFNEFYSFITKEAPSEDEIRVFNEALSENINEG